MRKIVVLVFFNLSSSLNDALVIMATVASLIFTSTCEAQTGTWTALTSTAPDNNQGIMLLLTDGTVICANSTGPGYGTGWNKLTPDSHGSYLNGTWSTIASMNYDRTAFSSQVLPNGQVYVAGGEYGTGGKFGEVYDAVADIWTVCGPIPSGWNIYDGNSEILYNGIVLEGPQIGANPSYDCLFYNPSTNLYTIAPSSIQDHDEASWLKLPDSSILFVGIASELSNRYLPRANVWVNDNGLSVRIYDPWGEESGPSFMLPNGKAIFFGAAKDNAIYQPTGSHLPGTWTAAAPFPMVDSVQVAQPDAPGAMMNNGHILLAVSPAGTSVTDEFRSPVYFMEYDYTTNTFAQVTSALPFNGSDSFAGLACYETLFLDLPDGNVLMAVEGTNQYYLYTPGSGPIAQGKPTIDHVTQINCTNYMITGKLFNGISEGAGYGDDWQMSTNYPIVRLTDGTNVYYAKTTNWNRIGAVQTDSLEDTAYFSVPSIPGGAYSLVVVANGNPSNPVAFVEFGVSVVSQTNVPCTGLGMGSATVRAVGGIGAYTYLWSPGGNTGNTNTSLSIGTYTVTVTNRMGCSATTVVNIIQNYLAVTTDSINVSQRDSCNGEAAVTASGGTAPYTYLWSPGGQTTDTINGQCKGNYCCVVTDNSGCSQTACVTIITGTNQLIIDNEQLTIYPNPNNGIFIIAFSHPELVSGLQTIEIYNVLGQKVYSHPQAGGSQFLINLNKPSGIYFYRVLNSNGSMMGEGKMIIEK